MELNVVAFARVKALDMDDIGKQPPDLITGWRAWLLIGSQIVLTALVVIGAILLVVGIVPTLGLILIIAAALLGIILYVVVELVWRVR
jgi:hypothetical protein